MDNYSKILTFFMENGVQLTQEQIEALKEEFLQEKSNFDKYIASKAAKAKEYEEKENHLRDIAKTSSGQAKVRAEQLANGYERKKNNASNVDVTTYNNRGNAYQQTAEDIKLTKEGSKHSKPGTDNRGTLKWDRGDARAVARNEYRAKAAQKSRGGVDTENRKPGTFLSK